MVPIQESMIRDCCREVEDLEGDVVEIGVHQGDSARVICESLREAAVYLYDTFSGMPEDMITSGVDTHRKTDFADTSVRAVQNRLRGIDNATFVSGVFPQSGKVGPACIKFAHIDVDLYRSTKEALEWCWPRMVSGGVILNDDYLCSSCPGAKKAVDEFVTDHSASCVVMNHRAILRRHR